MDSRDRPAAKPHVLEAPTMFTRTGTQPWSGTSILLHCVLNFISIHFKFLSVHIDDIILVAEEACHYMFVEHFSERRKFKADGPFGVEKPGALYYLKGRTTFDNEGLEIAASKKYVPKLSALLGVQDRRERGVPSLGGLDVYDAGSTPEEEFLDTKDAQTFRSALGILIY